MRKETIRIQNENKQAKTTRENAQIVFHFVCIRIIPNCVCNPGCPLICLSQRWLYFVYIRLSFISESCVKHQKSINQSFISSVYGFSHLYTYHRCFDSIIIIIYICIWFFLLPSVCKSSLFGL